MIQPPKCLVLQSTAFIVAFAESNNQTDNPVRLLLSNLIVALLNKEISQTFDFLRNKSCEFWRIGCIGGICKIAAQFSETFEFVKVLAEAVAD